MKNTLLFLLFLFISGCIHAQTGTTLFIRADTLNPKPVSRLIYGNFIELGFARQIEGLWNQKLYNASFEDIPEHRNHWEWINRSKKDNLNKEVWWHNGYEENLWYIFPEEAVANIQINRYWMHHGLQAVVVQNPFKDKKVRLAQDGIYLNTASPTRFSGYFSNSNDIDTTYNPVKITIGLYPEKEFDKPLYETEIEIPSGIWQDYSFVIPALGYKGRMTFAVSVKPHEIVRCDGFSLMPVDGFLGWRPQVVKDLKQIGVPILRYPGGCFASYYDWRKAIGSRFERQPAVSEYWGGIEENQAGTSEFVELCKMIESEPFIDVNMITGSASMAADWVEYCNGSTKSQMGNLRMQHGYPKPFKVKYWELDNEAYRRYGPEEYARLCVEYSKAMKVVDPDIKLVMIGYWKFNQHLPEMLKIAGRYIDLITERSVNEKDLRHNLEVINRYNRENGTSIKLCNTEWLAPLDWENYSVDGLNYQKSPNQLSLQENQITWNYAMNAARVLLMFQRLGGDFEFATFNNMANTWGQNIIECPKDTVFISAAGRAFELMSHSPVSWILRIDQDTKIKGVYTQAGISNDRKQLVVYVMNYNNEGKKIRINPGNYSLAGNTISVNEVYAASPFSSNTVKHPDEIHRASRFVKCSDHKKPQVTVLPWSITEIMLTVK